MKLTRDHIQIGCLFRFDQVKLTQPWSWSTGFDIHTFSLGIKDKVSRKHVPFDVWIEANQESFMNMSLIDQQRLFSMRFLDIIDLKSYHSLHDELFVIIQLSSLILDIPQKIKLELIHQL